MKTGKANANASGGLCLEFPGSEFREIGGLGAGESLLAVDDGVDLSGRKNEPIFRGEVLQTFHFTELEEGDRFFHCGFLLGFAVGLEGFQEGQVLLNGAIDALLVKGEDLELF